MKLIIFLFILSLSLSLSESRRKPKSDSTSSSDSSSDEKISHSGSSEDHSGQTRFYKRGRNESKDVYFNCKGKLRKSFAIELAFQHAGGNIVCSPVSALLPLGKLVLGAEGETRQELTRAIGDYKKSTLTESFTVLIKRLQLIPGVKLDVATRIYIADEYKIVPKFANSSKAIFNSGVEKVSFKEPKQAANEINGWVSRQTNGKIPLLLKSDDISTETSMIIVNAVYFKGKWLTPFKEVNVGNFYAPAGAKKVQLMSQQISCKYTKSTVLNAQIIQIPYEGSEAHFVVVLPVEKAGLPLLLNQLKLAPNLLNTALKKLEKKMVAITIPKFTITSSFDLKQMYETIGIKKMMSPKSGLVNIVEKQELQVSYAIQKAIIEVHETGTEASAASAVSFIATAGPGAKRTEFIADHPFLFYVAAHTEQLFAGIYSNP